MIIDPKILLSNYLKVKTFSPVFLIKDEQCHRLEKFCMILNKNVPMKSMNFELRKDCSNYDSSKVKEDFEHYIYCSDCNSKFAALKK